MRGVAFAWLTAGALTVALTSGPALAGCYSGDCDDYYGDRSTSYNDDYRSTSSYSYEGYSDRPLYRSYRESYSSRAGYYGRPRYGSSSYGNTVYYERGPEYGTRVVYDSAYDGGGYYDRTYYRRPYYSGYYRPRYYGYSGYSGYGGCGYYGCGYRGDNGYVYRSYGGYGGYGYRGYGYGYGGYGYGHRHHHHGGYYGYYPRVTVGYGGAWTQTAAAYGYGGCHAAYIPYGWTWYRATSC